MFIYNSICNPTRVVIIPILLAIALLANVAVADSPKLGRVLSQEEVNALPLHVFPDGTGLPDGTGNSTTGKPLYMQHCAACHGGQGEGGTANELVGDRASLTSEYPDRGIAAYWPHAPTLFEYIRRSMPPDEPASLTVDETYAIIAWLLELNGLIETGTTLDRDTLSAIDMPNRNGFIDSDSP